MCLDLSEHAKNNITCDQSWIFEYDTETKPPIDTKTSSRKQEEKFQD